MKHVIFMLSMILGIVSAQSQSLLVLSSEVNSPYSSTYTSEWGGYDYIVTPVSDGNIQVDLILEDSSSFRFYTQIHTSHVSRLDDSFIHNTTYIVTNCVYYDPQYDLYDTIQSPVNSFSLVEKGTDAEFPFTWQELHITNDSTTLKAFK